MLRILRDLQKGNRKTICDCKALTILRGIQQIQAFENGTLDVFSLARIVQTVWAVQLTLRSASRGCKALS